MVLGLIYIMHLDGRGESLGREAMFLDEVPVDTGDICTAVDQGAGFDDVHGVRRDNDLDRNLHGFGYSGYKYWSTRYVRGVWRRFRFPF